jgi:hypothetical protein
MTQTKSRKQTETGEGKEELNEKLTSIHATVQPNCHTILKSRFDFANSKCRKTLMWENAANSNICVRENKCISLSPSTHLNHHHIPQFGFFHLVSNFTGTEHLILQKYC